MKRTALTNRSRSITPTLPGPALITSNLPHKSAIVTKLKESLGAGQHAVPDIRFRLVPGVGESESLSCASDAVAVERAFSGMGTVCL